MGLNFIRVGDLVRDVEHTWPRFRQVGTVVSIKGNDIYWKSHTDGQIVKDYLGNIKKVHTRRNTNG